MEENKLLVEAAKYMRRRRWNVWLKSGLYGRIVQARLHELDKGVFGAKAIELGRRKRKMVGGAMRKYVMVDAEELKLFFRGKNGELATCILEDDVGSVMTRLHEGHVNFGAGITLGRAHERVYWPSRDYDIGRWVSSCESCQ